MVLEPGWLELPRLQQVADVVPGFVGSSGFVLWIPVVAAQLPEGGRIPLLPWTRHKKQLQPATPGPRRCSRRSEAGRPSVCHLEISRATLTQLATRNEPRTDRIPDNNGTLANKDFAIR